MQNLQHSPNVTLSTAMDAVFDACRANPGRLPCAVGIYRAKFNACADGESHIVMVSDSGGEVIASAQVDGMDC